MKAGLSHRHFPSDFFEDQSQNNVSVDLNKNSKKKLNPAESYLLSEGREQIRRNQNSGLLEPIANNKYYLSKIKEQNEQDNSWYIGNNFEKIRIRTSQGGNYSSRWYYQESYTDRVIQYFYFLYYK